MRTADATRKFHFLREIASGGFGRVYLCKVVHADGFSRLAAVKVLHPKWTENEEIAGRMRDEARLLGMLRHKNIVDVIDLTKIDGRAAVVMEFLEAVDLKVLIAEGKRGGARLPLKGALQVCAAVASALDAAYNRPPYAGEKPLRVIHRDIKPSNVMIDQSGLPKVLDFGVARAEFEAREAKTQELSFGSVEYMSPERLFFEPESPNSDVYSLGVMLYECVAFEKFGKAQLRADAHEAYFSERFEDLLEKHPMPTEEIEDMLHDLLYDMLAFEEGARPSAADCVTRLRSFARSLDGESLEEWAEKAVPPLVEKYQARPPRRVEGDSTSLVDRVLTEDTSGLMPPDDDETDVGGEEPPPSGDSSDRWDEMKKETLASLAGEDPGPVQSTWNPESEPVLQKALGPPPPPEGVVSAQVSQSPQAGQGASVPKAPLPRKPGEVTPLDAPSLPPQMGSNETPDPAPTVPLMGRKKRSLDPDAAETIRAPVPHPSDFADDDDDPPTVVDREQKHLIDTSETSHADPSHEVIEGLPDDLAAAPAAEPEPTARKPQPVMTGETLPVAPEQPLGNETVPQISLNVPSHPPEADLDEDSWSEEPPASSGGGGLFKWFVLAALGAFMVVMIAGGISILGASGIWLYLSGQGAVDATSVAEEGDAALVEDGTEDGGTEDGGAEEAGDGEADGGDGEGDDGEAVDDAPSGEAPEEGDDAAGGEEGDDAGEEPTGELTGAVFVSHLEGSKKIIVRCDAGSASGIDSATVEGDSPGKCTVTALGADRKRASTVVDKVEMRQYDCFADGTTDCK